jgi:hypothetical protein
MMQGYSSKDRKGNLFDEWDLSEAGGSELSEVPVSLLFQLCILEFTQYRDQKFRVSIILIK